MKNEYQSLTSSRIRGLSPVRRSVFSLSGFVVLALTLVVAACTTSGEATSASPQPTVEPEIKMGIELPGAETVNVPFVVSGWAVDVTAVSDTGIDVVQILDGGCEGVVIGIAEYGLERDDIQDQYGGEFAYSGWWLEVTSLRTGDHTLAARVRGSGSHSYDHCQAIQLTVDGS